MEDLCDPGKSAHQKMGELRRSNVLGVEFVAEPLHTVRKAVAEVLSDTRRQTAYLCPSGVHGVIEAHTDPTFKAILNEATFNVADGMPIVFVNRMTGYPDSERAFGPDIMWAILEDSVATGASHFFYGGKRGVAEALARRLEADIEGLVVAGTYSPPFRPLTPEEEDEVVREINSSGADVIWVGLSTPKQERWIARMRDRLNVKLLCSVGAAFDYHTGSIKPAPKLMKALALEWLYRLLQEPRRLWKRYLKIVPAFLFLITLQLLGLRRFPTK